MALRVPSEDRSVRVAAIGGSHEDPLQDPVGGVASESPPMISLGEKVGHYRIVARLNEGGMGVVFQAQDLLLGRDVAVKFLVANRANDQKARQRFRREATHLSQLDHNNICAVHDFGWTEDGVPYIVMALATGQSLREKLHEGPLDVDLTYEIAIQTARGLRHAHRKGIVHRDIKPANLVLTTEGDGGSGTVKIVDFGIAKGVERPETRPLTREGRVVGTGRYMAPEQKVEGAPIGPPADVWAFGLVLHELLTGELPRDRSHVSASELRKRVNGGSRLDSAKLKKLADVINRCLEPVPDKRYPSGVDLLNDLVGIKKTFRNRASIATLLAPVLAALLSLVIPEGRAFWQSFLAGPQEPVAHHVAVLPFTSSDPGDRPLAAGLTESISRSIEGFGAGTEFIWVLPSEDIQKYGVSTPEEAGNRFPVDLVISGEVKRHETGTHLELWVFDLSAGVLEASQATIFPLPYDNAFEEAVRSLLARILSIPGITDADENPATPQETSPASRYWVVGVGHLSRFFEGGSVETAIQLFQTAIAEDSAFAPAYAGLCQAYWELYRRNQETFVADTATRMCDHAARLAQDDPTTLTALGETQLRTGQAETSLQTLRRAVSIDSVSAEAFRWLGRAHESLGDLQNAERAYQRAIDLQPAVWLYPSELGILYAAFERHEEAVAIQREVIQLSPDNHFGHIDLATSLMALNQTEEAEAEYLRSIEIRPSALAYRNLGYLHLRNQEDDKAVAALQSSVAMDEADWFSWRWLGHAHHWQGENEQAEAAWRRMISLAEPGLAINPDDQSRLCALAEAHVLLGEIETGRRFLDQLAVLSPRPNYNVYWLGRIYEILDSREAALELVHRALSNGFDPVTVQNDRWLNDLRADPRFQNEPSGH